ncbi:MAG: TetR/AcrR family transcriptional regulator [Clostridiales bacterium]|jgi:AcrR family transcriptional regulator|nr:TetR/AcrR family transcriptional regulator [Clostridiales bacterium]
MRKSLSEREQNAIKTKLIESCRICWERYGHKKTGVAELAAMAGISTGAFYAFFPSKEMLFMETTNAFTKRLVDIMTASKPQNPTRYDLAVGFKRCIDEAFENKWIFSLREDAETFLRKLPEDFLEQDFQKDLLDITAVVNLYGLVPKVAPEEMVAVFHTLLMSINVTDIIGAPHRQALHLLTDSVIVNLFE